MLITQTQRISRKNTRPHNALSQLKKKSEETIYVLRKKTKQKKAFTARKNIKYIFGNSPAS